MAIIAMPTDRPTGPARKERQTSILRGLLHIQHERESLRRQEADLIDWARDEGVSWADIGGALGMSAEGVRVAYGKRQLARRAQVATCP